MKAHFNGGGELIRNTIYPSATIYNNIIWMLFDAAAKAEPTDYKVQVNTLDVVNGIVIACVTLEGSS